MGFERSRQIRMSDALWNLVGEVAKDLEVDDLRGTHSAVIREMVAAAAAKWKHSPYVCRSARHFLLVTRRGDVFYRVVQVLRLNSERQKLPCFVEMKGEKKKYYRQTTPKGMSSSDFLRSRWILNYFAAWQGHEPSGKLLSGWTDSAGAGGKTADLPIHLGGDRYVTREMIFGLRDYVQWKERDAGYDRAGIPVDIPSRNLEISVIVDEELYRHTASETEIPRLALELRNAESARFADKEVALYSENPIIEEHGRYPSEDGGGKMLALARELRERAVSLVGVETPGGTVVAETEKGNLLETLRLPERFLFYNLKWPSPHLALEVCVRWEKPVRG